MGTLKVQTQAAKDMLDALDDRISTAGAWALYTGSVPTDPDALPAGTLLKWGNLSNPAFGAAAESGSNDAAEVTTLTLQAEGSQNHVNAGTAGVLALFRAVTVQGDLSAANLVMCGDVAASGAWCTMSNTTITTADVDLTEANCTVTLANTQTV